MNGLLKQILDELKGIRARLDKEAIIPDYPWDGAKVDDLKIRKGNAAEKIATDFPLCKDGILVLPEKIKIGDTIIETEKLKPLLVALGTQPIKRLDIEFQVRREYDGTGARII